MRIFVATDCYGAGGGATARVMRGLVQKLATVFPVAVVTAGPTGELESDRTVTPRVIAVPSLSNHSRSLLKRAFLAVWTSAAIASVLAAKARRGDAVLVVTNPPLLPFFAALAAAVRGASLVLLVHDLYPDVLVATGVAKGDSILVRAWSRIARRLFEQCDRIIVIGRDMRDRVVQRAPGAAGRILVIPNWADAERIVPAPSRRNEFLASIGVPADSFVVQYSGNMGRTHDIDIVIDAAKRLPECSFVLIGDGAQFERAQSRTRDERLGNVIVLPPRPDHELALSLVGCDAAIVSFVAGMSGISVPSRMYNVMAAGVPFFAVADADAEPARVLAEENCGWFVPSGDVDTLVQTIRRAAGLGAGRAEMGARGRRAVELKYRYEDITKMYVDAFLRLSAAEENNTDGRSPEPNHPPGVTPISRG